MSKAFAAFLGAAGAFFGAEALAQAQEPAEPASASVALNPQIVTALDKLLQQEDSNARFLRGITYRGFVEGPAGSEKMGGYFVFKLAPPSGADRHLKKQSLHTRATGILDGLGIIPDADPNTERNHLLGQLLCGYNHARSGMRRNLSDLLRSTRDNDMIWADNCRVVKKGNVTELSYDYRAHMQIYGPSKLLERMLVRRHGIERSPLWRRGTELYVSAWLATYTSDLLRQAGIDPVSGARGLPGSVPPGAGAMPGARAPSPVGTPPLLPSLELVIYRLNPDNDEQVRIDLDLFAREKMTKDPNSTPDNAVYTVLLPPGLYDLRNEKGNEHTVVEVESPSGPRDIDGDPLNNTVRIRLDQPEHEDAIPLEVVVLSRPKDTADEGGSNPRVRYTLVLDTNAAEKAEQDALATTRRVIDGASHIWIRTFGGPDRSDEQTDHPNGANLTTTASDATYGVFAQALWFPGQTFDVDTLKWLGLLVRGQFENFAYRNGRLTGSQELASGARTFDFDFTGSDYNLFLQPGFQFQLNDPRVASLIHQLQLTYAFIQSGQTIHAGREEDRRVLDNETTQKGHGVRLAYLPTFWWGQHVRLQAGVEGTVFPSYADRQDHAPNQYGINSLEDLSVAGKLMAEALFAWRYAGVAFGGELGGSRFTTRQRGYQDLEGGNLSTSVRSLDYAGWTRILTTARPDFEWQFGLGYRIQGHEQDVRSSNPVRGTTTYDSTAHFMTFEVMR